MSFNSKIGQFNYNSAHQSYERNNSSKAQSAAVQQYCNSDQFISRNKKAQVSFSGLPINPGEINIFHIAIGSILGAIAAYPIERSVIYRACKQEVKDSDMEREIRDAKFVKGAFFGEGNKISECDVPKYHASIQEGLEIAKAEAEKRGIKITNKPEGFWNKTKGKLCSKLGIKPKEENIYAKAVRVLNQVNEASTEGILGKSHFSGETFKELNKEAGSKTVSALKNSGHAGIAEACGNILSHIEQIAMSPNLKPEFMSKALIYLKPLTDEIEGVKDGIMKASGSFEALKTAASGSVRPIIKAVGKTAAAAVTTLPKV